MTPSRLARQRRMLCGLGAALPFVARRLGPMGMVGVAVGAWAVGKLLKARAEADTAPAAAIGLPLPDLVEAPDPNPHPGADLVVDGGSR